MENDLFIHVRCLDSDQLSDVLKDAQTEGHVLPEETGVKIQSNFFAISPLDRNHGEGHPAVADVGVENALEGGSVADLALIHAADALTHGHHLAEV